MRYAIWCLSLGFLIGCAAVPESDPSTPAQQDRPLPVVKKEKGDPTRKPLDNAGMEQLAKTNPIAFLQESLNRYDREVRCYRVTLAKQEYITRKDGTGGKLRPRERIEACFREKPFSVLMHWKEGAGRATRTLFIKGENNDKLLAKPTLLGGLLPIQAVDPNGEEALDTSRFPITQFGIKAGSESALAAWKAADKRGELVVRFCGEKRLPELNNRPCWEIKRTAARPEEDGILESTFYFDKENWLQIGSILEGENGRLIAAYWFRDFEANPEFAADTFTRKGLKK